MQSIALLIPWFGPLPIWSDLYFHSCKRNSTVDFHFFTDADLSAYDATNIYVHRTSFQSYCQKVSDMLHINFRPSNPYKLCDLKPFYGAVHEPLLTEGGYSFWGFADIDLVWGDLRRFFTDQLLENYDVLSNHSDRLSGHLTLLRNTEAIRHRCFSIPHWQEKLSDAKHHALDEQDFTLQFYHKAHSLWRLHRHIFFRIPLRDEWRSYVRFCTAVNRWLAPRRILLRETYTTPFESHLTDPTAHWLYSDGRVIDQRSGRELPYLHFLCLKHHWQAEDYHLTPSNAFDRVAISAMGITYEGSTNE